MFQKVNFTRTSFNGSQAYGMTTLELEGPDSELQIKFISRLGKRERRAVIRSFLIQIRPWIKHFTYGAMDHSGDGFIRESREHKRGERLLKIKQDAPVTSLAGQIGFEIRMKRLAIGLTQMQLSKHLGITRSHLSDIERGVHLPNNRTRAAIEEALDRMRTETPPL